MRADDSVKHAINEEIHIEPYRPRWPALFTAERDRLLDLLPRPFLTIEHISSTAVPGLAAKPIIDILAGVSTLSEADALLSPLCAHCYETSAEFNATLPDSRWLMRHASGRRTQHLHLVIFGGETWNHRLQFRDRLRADPALATRYAHLKKELACQYRLDREAYTQAKTAFIQEALANIPKQRSPADT